jgi:hypothetical protein
MMDDRVDLRGHERVDAGNDPVDAPSYLIAVDASAARRRVRDRNRPVC